MKGVKHSTTYAAINLHIKRINKLAISILGKEFREQYPHTRTETQRHLVDNQKEK